MLLFSSSTMTLAAFAALFFQQLSPALPSAAQVFDDPIIATEIENRCRRVASYEPCLLIARGSVARLRSAYSSTATTPEQRLKTLTLIDADRVDGDVDWPGLAQQYFAWRGNMTGDTAQEIADTLRKLPKVTETRCWSGYYSSSCVTTTR